MRRHLDERAKRQVLSDLALCLQRLHTQGVVHADLKPDHVLLLKRPTGYRIRLIDLDSGFLKDDPPQNQRDLEGRPRLPFRRKHFSTWRDRMHLWAQSWTPLPSAR